MIVHKVMPRRIITTSVYRLSNCSATRLLIMVILTMVVKRWMIDVHNIMTL